MSRFKLLYFVIFIINLHKLNAQISDKRLCVDKECLVPISYAKTLLRYSSPDSRILSFAPNADITIYSKSAGSREDLWGGEINGKRGYIPKHMVRETKVLKKPTLLVDTELSNDTDVKQVPSPVEPNKVQEPYEVVDGTTIYLNPQDNISPSFTESPIQTTALPIETNKISESQLVTDVPTNEPPAAPEEKQETPQVQENVAGDQTQTDDAETEDNEAEEEEIEVELDEPDIDEGDDEDTTTETSSESFSTNKIDENAEFVPTPAPEDVSSADIQNENLDTSTEKKLDSEKVNEPVEILDENKTVEIELKDEPKILNTEDSTLEIKSEPEVKTEEIKLFTESEIKENVENNPGDTISKATITEEPKTIMDSILDTIMPQTSEENLQNNEELVAVPSPEVTTLSSEFEVPQPLDDGFVQVTENPINTVTEAPKLQAEAPTILPPLGLFAESKQEPEKVAVPQEEIVNTDNDAIKEPPQKEIANLDNTDFTNETPQEQIANLDSKQSQEIEESVKPLETEHQDPVVAPNFVDEDQSKFIEEKLVEDEAAGPGFLDNIWSFLGLSSEDNLEKGLTPDHIFSEEDHIIRDELLSSSNKESFCDATSCPKSDSDENGMDFLNFNSDVFLYLVTTAISVIIFLFGYIALDKSKREGPLIAKINKLEKELLVILKENQILQEKLATDSGYENYDKVSSEVVENLKLDLIEVTEKKNALEEQVQSLEKELENSTEVGMELNRMLTEILSSEGGSDILKANVENLQRQLVEQQVTINSVNETLAITNTENHELRLELELSNKKVLDLQSELDKLLLNILKIEEEKETQQSTLETEIINLREKYDEISNKFKLKENDHTIELKQLTSRLEQAERKLELKTKEYNVLTETVKQLKAFKNDSGAVQNLLEVGEIKAELQLLKSENQRFTETIRQEQDLKSSFEKRAQAAISELQQLKDKYDEADKLRVEAQTKLEVLSNYFKDREAQWQKEISKHEALWAEKEGEATSTTERIKFMQEQLQNYKAQTDSLKQEIMSQEIELKSQISVLEKKVHENWVSARQAERKLDDAKQEAAQLRHRLTLRERAIQEDKNQHRLQSPIEQNGDVPESPASPPLLYGTREHITKSPPLPGLPPFLPPPPGVPFMPPPMHGVPPFIPPPPPNMFPGDHRPPPLGRMSSPPLNSRYSPSSRGYSPYDRNSSSPSDSEYGTSPPHRRGYSPFHGREDRRDYKRAPPGRSNGRNLMKGGSSGSGHSNESLEKISRQQSKV